MSALYHRVIRGRGAAVDAPPRPHDDLPADRRDLHADRALVLHGAIAQIVLIAVWAFAGRSSSTLAWWNAPKPVSAALYLSTGWTRCSPSRSCGRGSALSASGLLALGGASTRWGGSSTRAAALIRGPEVFGYHEIFHLLVIVAAACQFAAVAIYALPAG